MRPESSSLVGQKLAGYHIHELLASSADGHVYCATQVAIGRKVALKVLPFATEQDRERSQGFLDEARTAAQFNHPNLIQIYDVGEESDHLFYSMEFVDGGRLDDRIAEKGGASWKAAAVLLADAVSAMVYLERLGSTLTEITPNQLHLAKDGRLRISSLSLQRPKDGYPRRLSSTTGELSYVAPEQLDDPSSSNLATVIYSVGCTFYYVLSGNAPFQGESLEELLNAKLKGAPSAASRADTETPLWFSSVLKKMMATNPNERPKSLKQLHATLTQRLKRTKRAARAAKRKEATRGVQPEQQSFLSTLAGKLTLGGVAAAIIVAVGLVVTNRSPESPTQTAQSTGSPAASHKHEAGTLKDDASPPIRNSALTAADDQEDVDLGNLDDLINRRPHNQRNSTTPDISAALNKQLSVVANEGQYAEALDAVAKLKQSHGSRNHQLLDAEKKILTQSREGLERLFKESEELAAGGKYDKAIQTVEESLDRFPDGLHTSANKRVSDLKRRRDETEEAFEIQFEETQNKLSNLLKKGDFAAAVSAVKSLPTPQNQVDEELAAGLAAEVELTHETWKALLSGLEKAKTHKRVKLRLHSQSKLKGHFSCSLKDVRVEENGDVSVTIARRKKDETTVKLLTLSSVSLFWLIGGADLTKLETRPQPSAQSIEGLGLVLFHHQEYVRAFQLLLKDLSSERQTIYTERLRDAVRSDFQRQMAAAKEALTASPSSYNEWDAICNRLEQLVPEHHQFPYYAHYRDKVRELYTAAFKGRGLSNRKTLDKQVRKFVNGKARLTSNQTLTIFYDFESAEHERDFVVKNGSVSTSQNHLVVRGECRLLHGNPFRDSISVTAVATQFKPEAPNLNIAVWTHENDRITFEDRQVNKHGASEEAPNDYVVFAVGYKLDRRVRAGNFVQVVNTKRRVRVPAFAIFGGHRGRELHSTSDTFYPESFWAESTVNKVRGKQTIQLKMHPDKFEWSVNRKRWDKRARKMGSPELASYLAQDGAEGSITLLTNGRRVWYDSIKVQGLLNQEWLGKEFTRRGEQRLDELENIRPRRK